MVANKTLALPLTQNTPLIATALSATTVAGLSYSDTAGNSSQPYKINIQWYIKRRTSKEQHYFYIFLYFYTRFIKTFYLVWCHISKLSTSELDAKMHQMTGKRVRCFCVTQTTSLMVLQVGFGFFCVFCTLKTFRYILPPEIKRQTHVEVC